ncbi:MAG: hypothetical protein KAW42_02065 [Candidatus Atribacteria bacterium]|nr:hypothetical protein [Candidatus Atribacteria bacterium]
MKKKKKEKRRVKNPGARIQNKKGRLCESRKQESIKNKMSLRGVQRRSNLKQGLPRSDKSELAMT